MNAKSILLSVAMLFVLLLPNGFSSDLPAQSNTALLYNVNREQTISGVVGAVGSRPGGQAVPGAHLRLLTAAGTVDVHLGPAGPRGAEGYGLRVGEQVEVTGCMVSFNGHLVFVARLVRRGSQVMVLRSKRGYPITSRGAEGRAAAVRAQ
jgi:hypothetical protein